MKKPKMKQVASAVLAIYAVLVMLGFGDAELLRSLTRPLQEPVPVGMLVQ